MAPCDSRKAFEPNSYFFNSFRENITELKFKRLSFLKEKSMSMIQLRAGTACSGKYTMDKGRELNMLLVVYWRSIQRAPECLSS
jgi:hypothetical protein